MAEPLQQGEIDALSADADRFVAELDEESYLHFAGLKDTLDLAPIYQRHERLTQLDTALALGLRVDVAVGGIAASALGARRIGSIAWAAVKRSYLKAGDRWVAKSPLDVAR